MGDPIEEFIPIDKLLSEYRKIPSEKTKIDILESLNKVAIGCDESKPRRIVNVSDILINDIDVVIEIDNESRQTFPIK